MEGFIILIKLLCAHLIADFVFQTDSIYKGRLSSGSKGILYQLLHSIIHAVTAYVFVADWKAWPIPVVTFLSHFIIDYIKYRKTSAGFVPFILDQMAHILVISFIWYFMYGNCAELYAWIQTADTIRLWVIVTVYILMLKPASIFLSLFLRQWTPDTRGNQSLPKAGQWIGYLERILTLTFVLIGSLEGVGFLLAAKSVFRFGELNKAKDIKTTEYVLIGTMSSFSIAILTGYAVTGILF